jgi:hypothetical protein
MGWHVFWHEDKERNGSATDAATTTTIGQTVGNKTRPAVAEANQNENGPLALLFSMSAALVDVVTANDNDNKKGGYASWLDNSRDEDDSTRYASAMAAKKKLTTIGQKKLKKKSHGEKANDSHSPMTSKFLPKSYPPAKQQQHLLLRLMMMMMMIPLRKSCQRLTPQYSQRPKLRGPSTKKSPNQQALPRRHHRCGRRPPQQHHHRRLTKMPWTRQIKNWNENVDAL